MYVVFAEELDEAQDTKGHLVETLEEAFAQIVHRCCYMHHFEHEKDGWRLVLTDMERPECSPEPIRTDYDRPRDAKHDLIAQAVDGRLKGHVAISYEDFERGRRRSA